MATYRLKPGHARTFLLGIARRPGEDVAVGDPAALGPADREALEAHFEPIGGQSPETATGPTGRIQPLLRNGMTAEQARAKLVNAGVTFADGAEGDALADLFDRAFGGAADGGAAGDPETDAPPAFPDGPDAASGGEARPAARGTKKKDGR